MSLKLIFSREENEMDNLYRKIILFVAGVAALLGIQVTDTHANVLNLNDKAPLYLEHSKSINGDIGSTSWHESHRSHASHESHSSHYSHRSGY